MQIQFRSPRSFAALCTAEKLSSSQKIPLMSSWLCLELMTQAMFGDNISWNYCAICSVCGLGTCLIPTVQNLWQRSFAFESEYKAKPSLLQCFAPLLLRGG